jgi:hypothetical protein
LGLKSKAVAVIAICVVAFCLTVVFPFLGVESLVMLAIFNLLFASIIFQLGGAPELKLSVLALGNFAGLFWNYVFTSLFKDLSGSSFAKTAFGATFCHAGFIVLFPFWNVLWFVSFWSLSLTVFPKINSYKVTVPT